MKIRSVNELMIESDRQAKVDDACEKLICYDAKEGKVIRDPGLFKKMLWPYLRYYVVKNHNARHHVAQCVGIFVELWEPQRRFKIDVTIRSTVWCEQGHEALFVRSLTHKATPQASFDALLRQWVREWHGDIQPATYSDLDRFRQALSHHLVRNAFEAGLTLQVAVVIEGDQSTALDNAPTLTETWSCRFQDYDTPTEITVDFETEVIDRVKFGISPRYQEAALRKRLGQRALKWFRKQVTLRRLCFEKSELTTDLKDHLAADFAHVGLRIERLKVASSLSAHIEQVNQKVEILEKVLKGSRNIVVKACFTLSLTDPRAYFEAESTPFVPVDRAGMIGSRLIQKIVRDCTLADLAYAERLRKRFYEAFEAELSKVGFALVDPSFHAQIPDKLVPRHYESLTHEYKHHEMEEPLTVFGNVKIKLDPENKGRYFTKKCPELNVYLAKVFKEAVDETFFGQMLSVLVFDFYEDLSPSIERVMEEKVALIGYQVTQLEIFLKKPPSPPPELLVNIPVALKPRLQEKVIQVLNTVQLVSMDGMERRYYDHNRPALEPYLKEQLTATIERVLFGWTYRELVLDFSEKQCLQIRKELEQVFEKIGYQVRVLTVLPQLHEYKWRDGFSVNSTKEKFELQDHQKAEIDLLLQVRVNDLSHERIRKYIDGNFDMEDHIRKSVRAKFKLFFHGLRSEDYFLNFDALSPSGGAVQAPVRQLLEVEVRNVLSGLGISCDFASIRPNKTKIDARLEDLTREPRYIEFTVVPKEPGSEPILYTMTVSIDSILGENYFKFIQTAHVSVDKMVGMISTHLKSLLECLPLGTLLFQTYQDREQLEQFLNLKLNLYSQAEFGLHTHVVDLNRGLTKSEDERNAEELDENRFDLDKRKAALQIGRDTIAEEVEEQREFRRIANQRLKALYQELHDLQTDPTADPAKIQGLKDTIAEVDTEKNRFAEMPLLERSRPPLPKTKKKDRAFLAHLIQDTQQKRNRQLANGPRKRLPSGKPNE